MFIPLNDLPYGYGVALDSRRRVDFTADGQPIGVELLHVSKGVLLDDLPQREDVAWALREAGIHILEARH
jgi:hypothetical protein